jgi:hypothetical protein
VPPGELRLFLVRRAREARGIERSRVEGDVVQALSRRPGPADSVVARTSFTSPKAAANKIASVSEDDRTAVDKVDSAG